MATITLTVPNDKANKVYDVFDRAYGHVDEDGDPVKSPTEQQKLDFVKANIVTYIRDIVFADDVKTATVAARPTKDDTVVDD